MYDDVGAARRLLCYSALAQFAPRPRDLCSSSWVFCSGCRAGTSQSQTRCCHVSLKDFAADKRVPLSWYCGAANTGRSALRALSAHPLALAAAAGSRSAGKPLLSARRSCFPGWTRPAALRGGAAPAACVPARHRGVVSLALPFLPVSKGDAPRNGNQRHSPANKYIPTREINPWSHRLCSEQVYTRGIPQSLIWVSHIPC